MRKSISDLKKIKVYLEEQIEDQNESFKSRSDDMKESEKGHYGEKTNLIQVALRNVSKAIVSLEYYFDK